MTQGQGKGAKNITNPYGFSTKEYNPKSGLSYFGARYYNPAVGRFVTKDPWPGTIEDPGSFVNKYAYCNNNPVNLIDPLGLCPNTAQMVYDFLIGDDINTLCDPNAGAGYKLLAAASITSNFIPGGGVVKGFKLVRLASKGMKVAKGAGKAGWKVGDDIYAATAKGNTPSWSAVRQRFWKNEATKTNSADLYGAENIDRMKKGLAPQRYNPDKGAMESMELSHEPIPFRNGGRDLVPRWPQDHAAVDPFRYAGY